MRNNFILLVTAIAVLCFLSCMQDHPNAEDVSKEVKINASIDGSFNGGVVTSRAVDQTWQSGDAIGVFMKKEGATLENAMANNAKFATSDATESFTPASENDKIYFPFNEKSLDFISYYPYKESLTNFEYEIDVSKQTDLSAIDFLYSDNIKGVNSSIEDVGLVFTHQLTKIVLDISANKTGKKLPGLKAKIENVNSKATFLLADGSLANKKESKDISFNVNAEGTRAEAMLLPTSDIKDKRFVITLDETNYSYTIGDESFVKGTQYNYNITINKGEGPEIEGVTATITEWEVETKDAEFNEDPADTTSGEGEGTDTGDGEGEGEGTDIGDGDTGEDGDGDTGDGDGGEGVVGDGTEANPYTIAQALEKTDEKGVWIKGYVVGFYKNFGGKESFENSVENPTPRLALAVFAHETDSLKTFPVELPHTGDIKEAIPKHFKKEVVFCGDIGLYNAAPGNETIGIVNIKKAKLGDVTYSK